jgi:hypothetical protein
MTKKDVYIKPRGGDGPRGPDPSPRKLYSSCPSCGEFALKVEKLPGRLKHAIVTCRACKMQRSIRYAPGDESDVIMKKLA